MSDPLNYEVGQVCDQQEQGCNQQQVCQPAQQVSAQHPATVLLVQFRPACQFCLVGGFHPLALIPPGAGTVQVGADLGGAYRCHAGFILTRSFWADAGYGLQFQRFFAPTIQCVADRKYWMVQEHAWTGMAHHHLDPGAHIRFVTMDRALHAGGLALLVRTAFQPCHGIVLQFPALRA